MSCDCRASPSTRRTRSVFQEHDLSRRSADGTAARIGQHLTSIQYIFSNFDCKISTFLVWYILFMSWGYTFLVSRLALPNLNPPWPLRAAVPVPKPVACCLQSSPAQCRLCSRLNNSAAFRFALPAFPSLNPSTRNFFVEAAARPFVDAYPAFNSIRPVYGLPERSGEF